MTQNLVKVPSSGSNGGGGSLSPSQTDAYSNDKSKGFITQLPRTIQASKYKVILFLVLFMVGIFTSQRINDMQDMSMTDGAFFSISSADTPTQQSSAGTHALRLDPSSGATSTVLVTGGAGFVGLHTSLELQRRGYTVVVIDNLNTYYSVQLKYHRLDLLRERPNIHFIEGDVCDEDLLTWAIRTYNIDRIIHLAAQAGVRYSLKEPHSYTKNNVDCTVSIFETAVREELHTKVGGGPIVYASSSSVYGFGKDPPFSEATSEVDKPASLYAATKRACELMAHTYHHLHKVPSIGLRFFTVYGPWGRPDMSPMIFADLISRGEPLTLNNFGNSIRDFTYVDDIANGVIDAMEYATTEPEVFNLGGSNPVKLNYFVELIEKGLGRTVEKKKVPMAKGDVPLTAADVTKAKNLLGWEPTVTIEEGLTRFLEWYKEKAFYVDYMNPKMAKTCIISSGYGDSANDVPKILDVSTYHHPDVKFYFFTNTDIEHIVTPGWEKIVKDLPYNRRMTQTAWVKYKGWEHSLVQERCETVFYVDASYSFESTIDEVLGVASQVHDSEIGFAQAVDINEPTTIDNKSFESDSAENVEASLNWLRSRPDFEEQLQRTYQTKYICYDPRNENFQQLSNFFWGRYELEMDSFVDAPLWMYTMHHFKVEPIGMKKFMFGHDVTRSQVHADMMTPV